MLVAAAISIPRISSAYCEETRGVPSAATLIASGEANGKRPFSTTITAGGKLFIRLKDVGDSNPSFIMGLRSPGKALMTGPFVTADICAKVGVLRSDLAFEVIGGDDTTRMFDVLVHGSRPASERIQVQIFMVSGAQTTASIDEKRRAEISAHGKALFKNTKNHCHAFRDLVAFAISKSSSTGVVLEDLKLVLIGEELRRRRSGPYYIGNEAGARGDLGFKEELRDGSPQVEHAMAAIYIGKHWPPGSEEALAIYTEIVLPVASGQKINAADVALWTIGGDAGQRVSDKELGRLPGVIERTMCA
jgi:hypothetical protein